MHGDAAGDHHRQLSENVANKAVVQGGVSPPRCTSNVPTDADGGTDARLLAPPKPSTADMSPSVRAVIPIRLLASG
jgi:hypothetical protein